MPINAPGLVRVILGTFNSANSKKRSPRCVTLHPEPERCLTNAQYCTPTMRDLPNMGESVRGKSSDTTPSQSQSTPRRVVEQSRGAPSPQSAPVPPATAESKAVVEASSSNASSGWADLIWQKWRWGLFIAIAVIVSRLSSS